MRDELIKDITQIVKEAAIRETRGSKKKVLKNPEKGVLSVKEIEKIRKKFYESNVKLFFNYYNYIKDDGNQGLTLDIQSFMKEPMFISDYPYFYQDLFYNEYYEPPTQGEQDEEKKNNPKYVINQQYFMHFMECTSSFLSSEKLFDQRIDHFR